MENPHNNPDIRDHWYQVYDPDHVNNPNFSYDNNGFREMTTYESEIVLKFLDLKQPLTPREMRVIYKLSPNLRVYNEHNLV